MSLRYFPRRVIQPDPLEEDDAQLPRMLAFRRRSASLNYSHLQVAQLRQYAVIAPPTAISVAQQRQYVILEAPAAISVAQTRIYVILITIPPMPGAPFGQWRRAMQDDGDERPPWLVLERREAIAPPAISTTAPTRRLAPDDDADAGQQFWQRTRRQATAPATPAPPTAPAPFLVAMRAAIDDDAPAPRRQAFYAPPPTPVPPTSWPPFTRLLWAQPDDDAPLWRPQAPSAPPVQQAAVPTAPSPWWAAVARQAGDEGGRQVRPGPFYPPVTPPSTGSLPFLFVIT